MGLLGGNASSSVDIEATKAYTFVEGMKDTIVCNHCEGSGGEKEYRMYYGEPSPTDKMRSCRWCDGVGTIKLRAPKAKK